MNARPDEKPEDLPRLARAFLWVDRPGNANRIFWGLAIFCVVLFLIDFTYSKHGHFMVEDIPGFFGVFGFSSNDQKITTARKR